MFFWNSLAFSMIQWMLAIWSLLPLPFLKLAWTSGSSQFMYCWSLAWRILSITLLACEMSAIVQYSFANLGASAGGVGDRWNSPWGPRHWGKALLDSPLPASTGGYTRMQKAPTALLWPAAVALTHPQRGKHTQGVTVSSWPLAEAATCTQNLAHEKMLSIINYKGSTNQTPMRCHLIPIRIAVMKKRTNNKCWPEHGEKGTLLHSWWECKLVQSPQKTVWKFLKKLKIELPYDSAIPVLDIYPKKMKTLIQKDICTWPCSLQHYLQLPKYGDNLSGWMDKEEEIYTRNYYLVIKKN